MWKWICSQTGMYDLSTKWVLTKLCWCLCFYSCAESEMYSSQTNIKNSECSEMFIQLHYPFGLLDVNVIFGRKRFVEKKKRAKDNKIWSNKIMRRKNDIKTKAIE